MGKALRISDLHEPTSGTGSDVAPVADGDGERYARVLEFLQGGAAGSDGKSLKTSNTITLRWECDGVTATITDNVSGRYAILPCDDLRGSVLAVADVLEGHLRVAWRASRWSGKKG